MRRHAAVMRSLDRWPSSLDGGCDRHGSAFASGHVGGLGGNGAGGGVLQLAHWCQLHLLRIFHVQLRSTPNVGWFIRCDDVACATMVTFAETSLYSADNNFDDIARLDAMLITMAGVTRTVFSASCCAAGVLPSLNDAHKVQHSLESWLSLLYWWLLACRPSSSRVTAVCDALLHGARASQRADPALVAVRSLGFRRRLPRLTTNAQSIVRHSKSHKQA